MSYRMDLQTFPTLLLRALYFAEVVAEGKCTHSAEVVAEGKCTQTENGFLYIRYS